MDRIKTGALSTRFFDEHLEAGSMLAILRNLTPAKTVEMCHQAWALDLDLVEVPLQGGVVTESFRAARTAAVDEGKRVGVGTVLTVDQALEAVAEGAAFAVSPGFDTDVAHICALRELPLLPGVATSTEIARALEMGFVWQKAFPAAELGASWIAAQLAPFPAVRFVATGGIDAANVASFFAAGAQAVGVGAAFGDVQQFLTPTDEESITGGPPQPGAS